METEKEVGIVSCGAYIPWNRLNREDIAKEWESFGAGQRAVASYDEDSLTMAVEATRNCMKLTGFPLEVDGLYFCSTTPPYLEKQSAAIIATALDLRRDITSADVTNVLRAGTTAMRMASEAVEAGHAKNVLVLAADCRLAAPRDPAEPSLGAP